MPVLLRQRPISFNLSIDSGFIFIFLAIIFNYPAAGCYTIKLHTYMRSFPVSIVVKKKSGRNKEKLEIVLYAIKEICRRTIY